jgi:hypothetical protein
VSVFKDTENKGWAIVTFDGKYHIAVVIIAVINIDTV